MNTLLKKPSPAPLSPPERNYDHRGEAAAMDAVGVAITKLNTVDRRAERSVRDLIKERLKEHIDDARLLKGFLSKVPHNSLSAEDIEKIVNLLEPEKQKVAGFHSQFNRLTNFSANLFAGGTAATQGALVVTAFERLKVCAEKSATSESPVKDFIEAMPTRQLVEMHQTKFKLLTSETEASQPARGRVLKAVEIFKSLPIDFFPEDGRTILVSQVCSENGAKPGLQPDNLLKLLTGMHEKYHNQPCLLGAGLNLATWLCLKYPGRLNSHIEKNRDTILSPASVEILQELMFRD